MRRQAVARSPRRRRRGRSSSSGSSLAARELVLVLRLASSCCCTCGASRGQLGRLTGPGVPDRGAGDQRGQERGGDQQQDDGPAREEAGQLDPTSLMHAPPTADRGVPSAGRGRRVSTRPGQLQEHRLEVGAHRRQLADEDALLPASDRVIASPVSPRRRLALDDAAVARRGSRGSAARSSIGCGGAPGRPRRPVRACTLSAPTRSSTGPGREQPAVADDRDRVADLLHLGQDVRAQQHGDAALAELADHRADVADAGRVEPVGGLVEDQQVRAT